MEKPGKPVDPSNQNTSRTTLGPLVPVLTIPGTDEAIEGTEPASNGSTPLEAKDFVGTLVELENRVGVPSQPPKESQTPAANSAEDETESDAQIPLKPLGAEIPRAAIESLLPKPRISHQSLSPADEVLAHLSLLADADAAVGLVRTLTEQTAQAQTMLEATRKAVNTTEDLRDHMLTVVNETLLLNQKRADQTEDARKKHQETLDLLKQTATAAHQASLNEAKAKAANEQAKHDLEKSELLLKQAQENAQKTAQLKESRKLWLWFGAAMLIIGIGIAITGTLVKPLKPPPVVTHRETGPVCIPATAKNIAAHFPGQTPERFSLFKRDARFIRVPNGPPLRPIDLNESGAAVFDLSVRKDVKICY
jgi:hypothetical protein